MKLVNIVITLMGLTVLLFASSAKAYTTYRLENGDLYQIKDGISTLIDHPVKRFAVVDGMIYIEGQDGRLNKKEEANPGAPEYVDGPGILQWEAVNKNVVYILGNDHRLWRNHPDTQHRDAVDAHVVEFAAVDGNDVIVKGENGLYWQNHGDYKTRSSVTSLDLSNALHVKVKMYKVLGVVVAVRVELDEEATNTLKSAADFGAKLAEMIPGVGDGIAAGITAFRFEIWAADTLGGHNGVVIFATPISAAHMVIPR